MGDELNVISPKEFVEVLKNRVKKDWDAVVAITGEEGSSKSTLASWLVLEGCLQEGMTEEQSLVKFVDYTIFSPNKKRVQEQITKSERYSIINADEAIKILYKQNWATPIQKFLNMFYALCRQENKISILCMPRFLDFNEFFRNHRIKFWIHVVDRGVGVIFEKDWFPASADPWFLKEAQKFNSNLYNKRKTGDFDTQQKINALSKLKNFIGIIEFEDLPNNVKKVYKDNKAKYAYQDLDEQVNNGVGNVALADRYKEKLIAAVCSLAEKGYSKIDIAKLTGLDRHTVYKYLDEGEGEGNDNTNNNIQEKEDNFD